MHKPWLALAVVLLAMGSAACTSQDDESVTKDTGSKPANPWQDQQKALQKAGQVEQDMLDAYQHRDKEMERQTQ